MKTSTSRCTLSKTSFLLLHHSLTSCLLPLSRPLSFTMLSCHRPLKVSSWVSWPCSLPSLLQLHLHPLWGKNGIDGRQREMPEVLLRKVESTGSMCVFMRQWSHVHSGAIRLKHFRKQITRVSLETFKTSYIVIQVKSRHVHTSVH